MLVKLGSSSRKVWDENFKRKWNKPPPKQIVFFRGFFGVFFSRLSSLTSKGIDQLRKKGDQQTTATHPQIVLAVVRHLAVILSATVFFGGENPTSRWDIHRLWMWNFFFGRVAVWDQRSKKKKMAQKKKTMLVAHDLYEWYGQSWHFLQPASQGSKSIMNISISCMKRLENSLPNPTDFLTGAIWGKLLQSTTFPGSTGCPLPSSLWGKKILAPSARVGGHDISNKTCGKPSPLRGITLISREKPCRKLLIFWDLCTDWKSVENFRIFSASQRECVWNSTLLRVT